MGIKLDDDDEDGDDSSSSSSSSSDSEGGCGDDVVADDSKTLHQAPKARGMDAATGSKPEGGAARLGATGRSEAGGPGARRGVAKPKKELEYDELATIASLIAGAGPGQKTDDMPDLAAAVKGGKGKAKKQKTVQ